MFTQKQGTHKLNRTTNIRIVSVGILLTILLLSSTASSAQILQVSSSRHSLFSPWMNKASDTSLSANFTGYALLLGSNGVPVPGVNITFEIYSPAGKKVTRSNNTGANGLASVSYDTYPDFSSSYDTDYGNWTIKAYVTSDPTVKGSTNMSIQAGGNRIDSGCEDYCHRTNTATGYKPKSPYTAGYGSDTSRAVAAHKKSAHNGEACFLCHPGYAATKTGLGYTGDVHKNRTCDYCHGDWTYIRGSSGNGIPKMPGCSECHPVLNSNVMNINTLLNLGGVDVSVYSYNPLAGAPLAAHNGTVSSLVDSVPCLVCHGPAHNNSKPYNAVSSSNSVTENEQCWTCHTNRATTHKSNSNCVSCHSQDAHSVVIGGSCTSCHAQPPDGVSRYNTQGAHTLHAAAGYGNVAVTGCDYCHVTEGANELSHPNAFDDATVAENTSAGITISAYAPNTSSGSDDTCSGVSCHTNGLSAGAKAGTAIWNSSTAGACNVCHSTAVSGMPATGSHSKHYETNDFMVLSQCSTCHGTGADAGTQTGHKTNALIDISFTGLVAGGSISSGTCTVYCHSPNSNDLKPKPTWGVSSVGCGSCHTIPSTTTTFTTRNGVTHISSTDCNSCHGTGASTGTHTGHINGVIDGGGSSCVGCHSTVSNIGLHSSLNGTASVDNGDCQTCHFGSFPMAPGGANYSNTYFCEDCHVSGGRNPAQYNNVPPSLKKTAGGHGLADCKWCHIAGDSQPRPLPAELKYHTSGPRGTAAGNNCLSCHYYANLPDLPFHAPGEQHSGDPDPSSCSGLGGCHDNADNHAVTYKDQGTLPSVLGLSVTTPITTGSPAQIQARVYDDMLKIAAAQYQVINASGVVIDWTNMTPQDGSFNYPDEFVNASINTAGLKGTYTVNVKGMASAPRTNLTKPYYPLNGQWSSIVNTPLTVNQVAAYKVSGRVTSASSGLPINGAKVELAAYPQYNATTNGNGDYLINIPDGTYLVRASAAGYVSKTATITVPPNATQNFALNTGTRVYAPWTATTQGWTTPYVIANKGSSSANVDISYYNQADGSYVGTYSVNNLLPGASTFVFREWTTANTDGSAVLLSDQPVSVMVDQFNNGQNKFGAYEVDQSGSTEVFLPWTATTQGWTTPFVIENRGTANATVSINYYNVDGSPAGSNSVDILPGASKFVFREWTTSTTDGAAKLTSNQPISVLVDMFKNSENKFGAYTPASAADTQVFIPWTATTQGWSTPYKIVNRGTSTAAVSISYYNQANGQLAGTDSVSIPPNGVAVVLRETKANGTDGSAVLSSTTQPISVLVEQFNNNEGKFEAYTPAMTANNTIVIPWTATTQGWTTPYVIVNRGSAAANVNIVYYNQADGSSVGTYSVSNLLPGASTFVFREWTAPNTDGSAVLTSNQPITVMVDQFNNAQNKFGAYTPIG